MAYGHTRFRHRFRRAGIPLRVASAVLIVAAAHAALVAAGGTSMRAFWIPSSSMSSTLNIRRAISSAVSSGYDAVIAPLAIGARSDSDSFDAGAELLREARERGVAAHLSVTVNMAASADELPASRDHVIYQHPEWLMVPRQIAAEMLTIDARSPAYLGQDGTLDTSERGSRCWFVRLTSGSGRDAVFGERSRHCSWTIRGGWRVPGCRRVPGRGLRLQPARDGPVSHADARRDVVRRTRTTRRDRGDRSLRVRRRVSGRVAALQRVRADRSAGTRAQRVDREESHDLDCGAALVRMRMCRSGSIFRRGARGSIEASSIALAITVVRRARCCSRRTACSRQSRTLRQVCRPQALAARDRRAPWRTHSRRHDRYSSARSPIKAFPAAVVEVGTAHQPLWRQAFGHLSFDV